VLPSVQLNYQALVHAAEVHDIWSNGVLASEFGISEITTTQAHPKITLRIGLLMPQVARKGDEHFISQCIT